MLYKVTRRTEMQNEKQPWDTTTKEWAADICVVAYMLGLIDNDSKASCMKVRKMLEKQMKAGRVVQMARGRYQPVNDVKRKAHADKIRRLNEEVATRGEQG
jgi:hypothetical protein